MKLSCCPVREWIVPGSVFAALKQLFTQNVEKGNTPSFEHSDECLLYSRVICNRNKHADDRLQLISEIAIYILHLTRGLLITYPICSANIACSGWFGTTKNWKYEDTVTAKNQQNPLNRFRLLGFFLGKLIPGKKHSFLTFEHIFGYHGFEISRSHYKFPFRSGSPHGVLFVSS